MTWDVTKCQHLNFSAMPSHFVPGCRRSVLHLQPPQMYVAATSCGSWKRFKSGQSGQLVIVDGLTAWAVLAIAISVVLAVVIILVIHILQIWVAILHDNLVHVLYLRSDMTPHQETGVRNASAGNADRWICSLFTHFLWVNCKSTKMSLFFWYPVAERVHGALKILPRCDGLTKERTWLTITN